MSSESGYYYVESAEEIRARRCAAAESRCARLRERLDLIRTQIEAAALTYGSTVVTATRLPRAVTRVAHDADRADREVDDFEREVEAAGSRLESALRDARSKAVSSVLAASLKAVVAPTASARTAAVSPAATAKVPGAEDWRNSVREEVERVMGRIAGDVDPSTVSELTALVRRISEETSADRAGALVLSLRERTQTIRETQAAVISSRAEVERLMRLLDGLEGSEIARVRARVAANKSTSLLPSDLGGEVERVAAAARRDRDRAFVAVAAAEALAELGYRVEAGFEIGVADGTGGIARMPESDTHGIRFRDDDGVVSINVVKFGDTNSAGDALLEQKFCDDSARIKKGMAARGVRVDLWPHRGAGIVPLQVLRRSPRPDRTAVGHGARNIERGKTR